MLQIVGEPEKVLYNLDLATEYGQRSYLRVRLRPLLLSRTAMPPRSQTAAVVGAFGLGDRARTSW